MPLSSLGHELSAKLGHEDCTAVSTCQTHIAHPHEDKYNDKDNVNDKDKDKDIDKDKDKFFRPRRLHYRVELPCSHCISATMRITSN